MSNARHTSNAAYSGRDSKRTPRAKARSKQLRQARKVKRTMQGR